jgi:hypothetical protein
VAGELGVRCAREPDLGYDLGGEVGERDGGMAGVLGDRRLGSVDTLAGPFGTLVVVGRLHDHGREAFEAAVEQGVRVRSPFQHREIGCAEITGQRGDRQQLATRSLMRRLWWRPG